MGRVLFISVLVSSFFIFTMCVSPASDSTNKEVMTDSTKKAETAMAPAVSSNADSLKKTVSVDSAMSGKADTLKATKKAADSKK